MKREFLKSLGIGDDAIDAIMAENGRDLATMQNQVNALNGQLTEANKKIEKSKDYETIKQQLETEKANNTKISNELKDLETKSKNDLLAVKKENAIKLAVAKSNPIDTIAYMAHLKQDKIVYNDETGELTGFKEQDDDIRSNNAYLFNKQSTGNEHGNLGGNNVETGDILGAINQHYDKK